MDVSRGGCPFRVIVQNMPMPFVITKNGKIYFWNDAFSRLVPDVDIGDPCVIEDETITMNETVYDIISYALDDDKAYILIESSEESTNDVIMRIVRDVL